MKQGRGFSRDGVHAPHPVCSAVSCPCRTSTSLVPSAGGVAPWFNALTREVRRVCNELPMHERGIPLRGEVLKIEFSPRRKHLQLTKNTHC